MADKLKQGAMIDLGEFLGKARQRIYRIGVELEGGWDKLPSGVALQHDGSVRFQPLPLPPPQRARYDELYQVYNHGVITREQLREFQTLTNARQGPAHVGELASDPLESKDVGLWMKTFYPQYVNSTCGLHVHMSFRSALTYQRLMTPNYQATMLGYLLLWAKKMGLSPDHHIWGRLAGKSTYCRDEFHADAQARTRTKDHDQRRPGHRYTVINYCYGLHQTVECRVLPMMDTFDLAISAVEEVLRITNAFLVTHERKEQVQKIPSVLLIEDDLLTERIREFI